MSTNSEGCLETRARRAGDDPFGLEPFFRTEGYAVVRDVVPPDLCRAATQAFERDVKPSRKYFLRHESGHFEKHVFTEHGFMKYPIMNIQDLTAPRCADFRRLGLEILTHRNIQAIVTAILGERGRVIHTMYFDGNQRTWCHRDSHYINAEEGQMIGVWVAAEDIHPGAGRFYVYAGSHRVAPPANLGLDDMDPNSREYKEAIGRFAEGAGLPRIAPSLGQGDVLLWSSLTIHGSLETTEPSRSRKSFTAHYIPESQHFLDMRRQRGGENHVRFNGVKVSRHHDQGHWLTQTMASVRTSLAPYPRVLGAAMKVKRMLPRRDGVDRRD